jgi:hypothetical protein
MTTGATGQLGLALPVQGELSGTWGDTVNNGITQYTNIAIAATLTLTDDGAVTLANTTGDATASNITSSLTGAGTVTAQFAIVRVTGTLTTAKVVTAPSYSKTYTVVNAATGGIVTFKASGQTGVSIAVGESAFVYFNGTDYVKISSTAAGAAGGSNTQVQFNSSGALAGSANLTYNGTTLTAVNNASTLSMVFSRTSATARDWALGVDGDGAFRITDTGAGGVVVLTAGAAGLTTLNSASELVFKASNTEGMRLTSTGLGIGTTSPSVKLQAEASSSTSLTNLYLVNSSTAAVTTKQSSQSFRLTDTSGTRKNGFQLTAYSDSAGGNIENGGLIFTGRLADVDTEFARIASSGNVGIGTSTPRSKLDVNGNLFVATGGQIQITGNPSTAGLQIIGQDAAESIIGTLGSQPLVFRTASSEKVRLTTAGGWAVGTTSDPGAGAIYATGNITAFFSDKRLKTVSGKIENALDKVAKLSGVYYTFNDTAKSFGYDSDEEQVGVIAQEVEAVLPQIVKAAPFDLDENNNSKSGENYKTVQYDKLVPLLIEAINELQAKVKALEAK